MLKLIDPILSPELLYALRAMGHRHDIAIVDANFPCDAGDDRLIRLDGVSGPRALEAILKIFPLEEQEPHVAWRMIAEGDAAKILPVFEDYSAGLEKAQGRAVELTAVEPDEFKDRVRAAHTVVVTGERRFYGSVILRKGVIAPE
ncbi:transport protein RbsD/FucU [Rhizobium sp. NLR9b]|uniref:RbsD/FucU family protein n=1 Tax=unclassified Rhizobium TaxID=2613769 RepID=UPI001C8291CB|nr:MULTISPECIES: RbsD/FucU domain-containing protein [unclassified Rhizobium]MBX5230408.1 transport protein RbsD/FucU [Rhizobium sp. NLR9b]MBX5291077.1 transport protein RbsD/FucU [Rhizobium sp. NLR10b]